MIRKVQRSDKPIYREMVNEFYRETERTIPEKHIDNTYREMMRGSAYLSAFVFITEGKTVGYALVSKSYSQQAGGNIWWIDELYVRPDYRGQGIAREFFEFLEANCSESVKKLRIELDIDSEIEGSLYEQLGFKQGDYCELIRTLNE